MTSIVKAGPLGAWHDVLRGRIASVLSAELTRRRAQMVAIDPRLTADADRLVRFAGEGGKAIRATLLCLGYAVSGPEIPAAALRAAAALELLQACALMHDDIIDRADLRRGRPSVHRAVAAAHRAAGGPGDSEHTGTSVALLLGDLALAWADDLFCEAAVELGAVAEGLRGWSAMRTEVLSGQLLDLLVTVAPATTDPAEQEADATTVNLYKTASYTVTRPLLLGAALADADEQVCRALAGYGRALGLAFQLRDDLLGVFGDPAVTGKPAGDDLVEGKQTVLLARARAALRDHPHDLARLDAGIGTVRTPEEVAALTELIAESGAAQQVSTMIEGLRREAMAALEPAPATAAPEALDRLRQVADWLVG